jgi:hypothetical protein
MKKFALIILISLFTSGCKKKKIAPEQPPVQTIFPDQANGIPNKNKVLLIDEDFNNNNNAWNTYYDPDKSPNYMKIEGGFYSFYNIGEGTMLNHSNRFNFDQSQNFEIETKLSATTKRYGFYWASYDLSSADFSYRLEFDEGKMDFVDIASGFIETYVVRDKAVESTASALIKIRKIKDKYFFFLNENLVYQGSYLPSRGQSLGYYFMGKGNLDADYIRISRLDI